MAINTKAVLNDSAVEAMSQAVIISGTTVNKIDAYATVKHEVNASSIDFTVYSRMNKATTPLTDGTDAGSTSMQDSKITFVMSEYGNVITTTKLANIATQGKADLAAAELIGINVGETTDTLGISVLEAGTNTIAAITANELSTEDLRAAYDALAADSIAKFGDGRYVAFINPAQISDIKDDFIDIAKNNSTFDATSGIVGAIEGFTIVEDANVTAGKVVCFGYNALGLGVSINPELLVTDGNDSLGRLLNVGWYSVLKYGAVDQNALRVITGA